MACMSIKAFGFMKIMMLDVCCNDIRVRLHRLCDLASAPNEVSVGSRKAHLVATKRLNNGTRPNA